MKKFLIALMTMFVVLLFGCSSEQETQSSDGTIQSEQTNDTNSVAEQNESDNTTDVVLSPEEQGKRLKEHLNFLKETYEAIKNEFENQKSNYNEDIWINFVNETREKVKQKRVEFDHEFSPAIQKAPDYFDEVVLLTEFYSTLEVSLIKEMWDYLDDGSGDPETPMNEIETNLEKLNL